MYLFDADSLILANRHDFPLDKDPGTFWQFLERMGQQGEAGVPEAVLDEITRGVDSLSTWLKARKNLFFIPTGGALPRIREVLAAYGPVTDVDLEQLHADPYLIAHALALAATVVTNEASQPAITDPFRRKIPDICARLGVRCLRYPRFLWEVRS
ncbi:MAG: DUF4411 family protein [Chloroflexi bacterium]|nr:DUF4411 family protein [Chloroflexota bacterium]